MFGYLLVFLFACIWGFVTKIYLPKEINDSTNKNFDERQSKILLEVFSNTLVWTVYALILAILLRLTGLSDNRKLWFSDYPEVGYILIIIVLFVINLFYIRNKYSFRE